jgi:uncharacterized membrane protein
LFCYAERPPRLLSIGGDRRWEEALDRQAWEWESAGPEEMPAKLSAIAAGDYDAVVIGALTSRQFRNEDLQALAQAVRERGVGLFMWNGDHDGQSELTEAVLTTYRNTPLESILPVHVDPRKVKPEPPPRQVIVVVDRSGSMSAGRPSRLARAQSICRSIIGAMRPEDTLDLLAFDDRLAHLVDNEAMTPDAKARAIAQVDGLTIGGGTLPSVGLTFLARRTLTRAALIFISDGGFDPGELAAMSVFASTNAFATVEFASNTNQPSFGKFPTVVPALESFDASKLQLKFFQREERNKFFESGRFDPVETPVRSGRFRGVSLPGLILNGNAVCFAKPDAAVIGVRRKIADPVLVYGEAGEGRVGVFTSGLTDEWLRGETGRSAINGWLKQLVPFSERDRYDFKIDDDGQTLRLEVTILARNERLPRVEALNAFLSNGPRLMKPVHLTADPNSPGTFRGQASIERTDHSQLMHLTLTESGAEAVPRPQRVPLLVPPAGHVRAQSTEEAWTHGRNTKLLEQLAEVSGGRLVDTNAPVLFTDAASARREYWRELIAVAAFLYLAAIGVRRWNG